MLIWAWSQDFSISSKFASPNSLKLFQNFTWTLSFTILLAAAAAESLQLCLTLCDPIDGSPPGSPVPGILQARTLEWVAISSPMHEREKWKWSRSLLATPWTAAYQAPPMGFSRQAYWSGLPLPSPPILLNGCIIKTWLPWWFGGKESTCQLGGCGFDPWVIKISWRRKWQPTPVFLPRKSHGQRSLVGYSPWSCKESDMT